MASRYFVNVGVAYFSDKTCWVLELGKGFLDGITWISRSFSSFSWRLISKTVTDCWVVSSVEEGSFSAEPFLVESCLAELCLAELCLATAIIIQECYLDDLFPSLLNSFYQFMLSLLHAMKKIVEQSDWGSVALKSATSFWARGWDWLWDDMLVLKVPFLLMLLDLGDIIWIGTIGWLPYGVTI